MLIYPDINPVALHLGPIKIYWYGLMYLVSFLIGWRLALSRAKTLFPPLKKEQIGDLVFYVALGVIFGGRLGYMLFYDLPSFIHAPWILLEIWKGGMSFHGGFLGVLFALLLWIRKNKRSFIDMTDFVAPMIPIGLAAGRLGNFLRGELWGNVTTMPWGMVYPPLGNMPRHPSQIYEFLLEGILLFTILWLLSKKEWPRGTISGLFLIGYATVRCFCEFFRTPDPQWGYLAFHWLTMGQILWSIKSLFLNYDCQERYVLL